jgi:TusA-related sulfurtransferase
MSKMTLEEMLDKMPDGELIDIYTEIDSAVVPATGFAHSFIRKVNRMIDKGELCINPSTYRKVYLPTLVKVIQKELSRRYVGGKLCGK